MVTRILIVDDKEQVRKDLRTLLALYGDFEILGEAANGLEAIRFVETMHPDAILLDLEMPVMDGCETASQIKALAPSCRVIILTVHDYPAAKHKAIRAGADSFFVKGTPIEQLIQAILGEFDIVEEDL